MALLRTARLFIHYEAPANVQGLVEVQPLATQLFVCPAGFRAILRSAQFFLESEVGSGSLNLFTASVPEGVVVFRFERAQFTDQSWHQWNGHLVLDQGDRLEYSGTSGTTMVGSGALMPLN